MGSDCIATKIMARTFTFRLKRSPEEMLRELSQVARSKRWTLRGNATRGSFSDSTGMLKGRYEVEGNNVHVTIVRKPFTHSWEEIESKLADYFC